MACGAGGVRKGGELLLPGAGGDAARLLDVAEAADRLGDTGELDGERVIRGERRQ